MTRAPRALAALAVLLLAAAGAEAAVVHEVELVGGGTLRVLRAERQGATWKLVTASGTTTLPASRVASVRAVDENAPRSGRDAAPLASLEDVEPEAPTALAGLAEARARAAAGDLAGAERAVRERIVAAPGDAAARVALGELLVRQGRFHEAVTALRTAPAEASVREARALALAAALSRLDRDDEALAALDAAPSTRAVRAAREELARDSAAASGLARLESAHFRLLVERDADSFDAAALLDELESIHALLREALGGEPPGQVVVIVHPGREFWSATGMGREVGGLYDGKVRVPSGGLESITDGFRALLRHEVAHAFVDALSGGRADVAWHEGIAEHFEGDPVAPIDRRLAQVFRKDPSRWPPAFDHPTAHSRVDWLVRTHGLAAVRDLLRGLARGQSTNAALVSSVGLTEDELDLAWGRALAAAAGD